MSSVLAAAETTSVFLVRHTEKDLTQTSDPQLTDIGKARAEQWANILQYEQIVAVFSTDTTRTRDTAAPIAAKYGLEVKIYPAKTVTRNELLAGHEGKDIVVVGHSNTIPGITNMLVDEKRYSDLSEDDYDSLFIVDIVSDSSATVTTSRRLIVPLAR
jgi:broad specificity phosphatase PhoE